MPITRKNQVSWETQVVIEDLKRRRFWPIRHTQGYYRRVARQAPEALVRALVLAAALRLPRR